MRRYPVNRVALAAALLCLLVFLRALGNDFVGLDDGEYILKNAGIRQLDARLLVSAFTRLFAGDYWMPLTWLSFAVDYRLWGLNPLGYHLTNILLHAANTGVVVLVADRLCRDRFDRPGSPSFLYPAMLLSAGLLFGIHPLRVESVAWVTERKDVLNGLFALGSILCYLDYARARETGDKGTARRHYLLSLALFLFSLMAKPVSVVLPALLLVADWYPLGRLRKGHILPVLAEKIPFFVGSAAMATAIVLIMTKTNNLISGADLPFGLRAIVSGNAVFEYVRLQLFPVGILPFYVLAKAIPPAFAVKTVVVVLFTCLCLFSGRRKPWIAATWLSFVIPLLPVLAFFYNGIDIAYAARFTYLPAAGPSIVAAALLALAYERTARTGKRAAHTVAVGLLVVLLLYAGTTWRLIGVWRDTGTLWTRVIEQQPLGRAYQERGLFHLGTGKYPEAVEDLSTALAIASRLGMPENYNILAHRGEALRKAGRNGEAVRDFDAAIALNPQPVYFHLRGLARKALGETAGAAEDLARGGSSDGRLEWY